MISYMSAIQEPNDKFEFDKLTLTSPISVSGGNHFIKYVMNGGPLYVQPPNCLIKSGIVKAGKRAYCDLMFTNENEAFINWMENLEERSRKHIFNNRGKWFESELEEHDIENSFASSLKLYKSGKYYIARVNIPSVLGKTTLKVYDENENLVDVDSIKENEKVATILEIQGIKCSPRNFQIEIEMKQLLILKPVDLFEKCIFKNTVKNEPLEELPIKYEPEPVIVEEPEPVIVEEPESVIVEEPEPVIVQEPEPVIVEEPEPETVQEQKPIVVPGPRDLEEVELHLDEITPNDTIVLKKRTDVYYNMYREALRKAKVAKNIALASYLDARNIKNTYMLTDLSDDSDVDDDSLDFNE
jgi:hypothetical protein